MKKLPLPLVAMLLSVPSVGFTATDSVPVQPVSVTVTGDARELAVGYTLAFAKLRRVPFQVQLQHEGGKPILIQDVKTVSAAGSVLVIETSKGLIYAVNPNDVIWVSDAPVEKPVASESK